MSKAHDGVRDALNKIIELDEKHADNYSQLSYALDKEETSVGKKVDEISDNFTKLVEEKRNWITADLAINKKAEDWWKPYADMLKAFAVPLGFMTLIEFYFAILKDFNHSSKYIHISYLPVILLAIVAFGILVPPAIKAMRERKRLPKFTQFDELDRLNDEFDYWWAYHVVMVKESSKIRMALEYNRLYKTAKKLEKQAGIRHYKYDDEFVLLRNSDNKFFCTNKTKAKDHWTPNIKDASRWSDPKIVEMYGKQYAKNTKVTILQVMK